MKLNDATEKRATRDGLGDGLLELGRNPKVVVLCADLEESTKTRAFRQKHPKRFFEAGVAEMNLIGMATGLALNGYVPFATTFAVFGTGLAYGAVRQSVAINKANVKIACTHAGVTVGEDGETHQMLEDVSLMAGLGITTVVPCDYLEAKRATIAAAALTRPVYLRFGREKTPVITNTDTPFKIGKAEVFREGRDVAIIASGVEVFQALEASNILKTKGISARVINCHTLPLDEKTVLKAARECGAIVTAEEHSVHGGLGSTVSRLLAEKAPTPIEFVGTRSFGESGTASQLMEKHGLTAPHLARKATRAESRK